MKEKLRAGSWLRGLIVLLALLFFAGSGSFLYGKLSGDPLPEFLGWSQAVVMSGSMEPEIPVGALVLIREQSSYTSGDVVVYEDDAGNLITHRLLRMEDGKAVTKGDANNVEDEPIETEQILGKVRAVLPGAGDTVLFFRTPMGMGIVLCAAVLSMYAPGQWKARKEERDDGTKK